MRNSLFVIVIAGLSLAIQACAQNRGGAEPPKPKRPTDWTWLRPGKTSLADVKARGPEPTCVLPYQLFAGTIDILLELGSMEMWYDRNRSPERAEIDVEVAEFESPDLRVERLVFVANRLLYAVILAPEGERGAEEIKRKHGEDLERVRTLLPNGSSFDSYLYLVDANQRVAFAQRLTPPGEKEYTWKIVWSAPGAFDEVPPLKGVAWTLLEIEADEQGEKKNGGK